MKLISSICNELSGGKRIASLLSILAAFLFPIIIFTTSSKDTLIPLLMWPVIFTIALVQGSHAVSTVRYERLEKEIETLRIALGNKRNKDSVD
jgi:hypothetical protein